MCPIPLRGRGQLKQRLNVNQFSAVASFLFGNRCAAMADSPVIEAVNSVRLPISKYQMTTASSKDVG